jgi:hypothetical protein
MSTHRIRLRGPWEYQALSPFAGVPDAGRVTMPAAWRDLFGDEAGRVLFRRRFNRPSNLDASGRVRLVFEGVRGGGEVRLNGRRLANLSPEQTRLVLDVSDALEPHCLLEVEMDFDPAAYPELPGGLYGLVALEIDEPADA